jgi:hypothetical protein
MAEIIIHSPIVASKVDAVVLNGQRYPLNGLCKIEFTVEANGPVRLILHYFPTIGKVTGIDLNAHTQTE